MDLKTLREEYTTLHGQASNLLETTAKAGRAMTAEEKTSNDGRYARMDVIKGMVDEDARLAKYAFTAGEVVKPAAPIGKAEFDAASAAAAGKPVTFDAAKFKAAVNHYARTGHQGADLFAVTTGTQSGVLLPKIVLQPIETRRNQNAIRAVLAGAGLNPIEITSAASISLPISNDLANVGQAQSEGATSGTSADSSFSGSLALNPTLYSSKQMWFSSTQASSAEFDVFQYALPVLQKRLDKVQESAWTTILQTATVGKTTASASAITYAEILAREHSLANAYRIDAAFVLSYALYALIRGLVDSNNRPIIDLDPTNVFQGKIHGKNVVVSDYMSIVATGNKSGAFVSAEALKVLDVMNTRLARYTLVPNNPDQTGYELFQNADFNFDPNGVRLLAQP